MRIYGIGGGILGVLERKAYFLIFKNIIFLKVWECFVICVKNFLYVYVR